VTVVRPDGTQVEFAGERVLYGRLEREGIYEVRAGGRRVAALDVNLLSEQESDLSGAASLNRQRTFEGALRERPGAHRFHAEFALVVAALLLGVWALLERRSA
jgi:hypothetical protein